MINHVLRTVTLFITFLFILAIAPWTAHCDEDNLLQKLREKTLSIQSFEQALSNSVGAVPESISSGCLSAPLPTTPKTPNYSVTQSATAYKTSVVMTFWRETCQDGTGSALLMRATPKTGKPFICGGDYTVTQNGVQYNNIALYTDPANSTSANFCDDLLVPTTMAFTQFDFADPQFDPAQALTIVSTDPDSLSTVDINVPLGGPTTSNIQGTADGYKSFSVTCKNTRTGKVVTIHPPATSDAWNCGSAGLSIKSGDKVQVTITGSSE